MWLVLEEKATQRACRWVQLFWFCCSARAETKLWAEEVGGKSLPSIRL
jgi:hypothetical protein